MPIHVAMDVSVVSSDPVVLARQAVQIERAALVMNRQRDVAKAQAQALVALVQQAGDVGRLINVYA
jgi:hypothetical protein